MENQWVEVSSCNWLHEALFLKSVLEAADLEVLIPDEHTLSLQPGLGVALGGVRLLVRSTDVPKARDVIAKAADAGSAPSTHPRRPHGHP
jgi:hypothetical protein